MNINYTYKDIFADIQKKKYFLVFTISIFPLSAALSVVNSTGSLGDTRSLSC